MTKAHLLAAVAAISMATGARADIVHVTLDYPLYTPGEFTYGRPPYFGGIPSTTGPLTFLDWTVETPGTWSTILDFCGNQWAASGCTQVATGGNSGGITASLLKGNYAIGISGPITGPTAPIMDVTYNVNNGWHEEMTGGAPEASTWAMVGLGFAALGFAGYRRQTGARLATLA